MRKPDIARPGPDGQVSFEPEARRRHASNPPDWVRLAKVLESEERRLAVKFHPAKPMKTQPPPAQNLAARAGFPAGSACRIGFVRSIFGITTVRWVVSGTGFARPGDQKRTTHEGFLIPH